jgi:hypothetical protein
MQFAGKRNLLRPVVPDTFQKYCYAFHTSPFTLFSDVKQGLMKSSSKQLRGGAELTNSQKITLGLLTFGSLLSAAKYALFQLGEFWHFVHAWWINL